MQELNQFKTDLDTLRTQRSHIQIKLEESMARAKTLKETLAGYGYQSLAEAKEAYKQLLADADSKHEKVKQLISQIKSTESSIPTKEEILSDLRDAAAIKNVQVPADTSSAAPASDFNINL